MSNRHKLIVISSFLLLSIIGIGLFASSEKGIFHTNEINSDKQKDLDEAFESLEQNSSAENSITTAQQKLDAELVLSNTESAIIESSQLKLAHPIAQIYSYEVSLTDGMNRMASEESWSYDEIMKNIALWENLCAKDFTNSSTMINDFSDPQGVYSKISILCEGLSSKSSDIDDFIEVEIDESAAGINDRASLESSLGLLGPDSATKEAIYELSDALDSSDYARVIEVIWFLGIHQFGGVSEEFKLYTNRPNVETIFSVAASIYCNYIGGCYGDHPVTLNLCFQFEDLPCSRPPNDILDSIDQILTGHEIDTFNQMNVAIIRLLNRHYRNEL